MTVLPEKSVRDTFEFTGVVIVGHIISVQKSLGNNLTNVSVSIYMVIPGRDFTKCILVK